MQDLLGTGSILSDVQNSRVDTSTACCKLVSFSNVPAFVYSDISKYTIHSAPSSYLFSYTLSDLPDLDLTITPALLLNGVAVTTVSSTPLNSQFTKYSLLSGQFYLSSSLPVSGLFTLSLKFSGSNALQYSTIDVPVQLLSTTSAVPAPKFVSSQFTDSGQAVILSFDVPTDLADITSSTWFCSDLFQFTLADSTKCSWTNSSAVTVTFGYIAAAVTQIKYLTVNDPVTLLGGKLRSFCTSTKDICKTQATAALATVNTLAPRNPSPPTVIVSAPPKLGTCTNLTLDATGSYGNGGRPYSNVAWTVTTDDQDKNISIAIEKYLNSYSLINQVQIPIPIPMHFYLSRTTLFFSLSLTNFLGLTSVSTIATRVEVTGDSNQPALSVLGPTYLTVQLSSTISIQSIATLPICATDKAKVLYVWTVFLGGVDTGLTTTSQDSSKFLLPPYKLIVDKTYTVTVTATHGTSVTSTSVTVYVAHGNVDVIVLGGYSRASTITESLVMNATLSTDADEASGNNLLYKVQRVCCLLLCHFSSLNYQHSPLYPYSLLLFSSYTVVDLYNSLH